MGRTSALFHYRFHHVFVTATSSPPRVTDSVAWLSQTEVTLPPPNVTEMLIAALKHFSHAIKQFNLTGNFIPPTLIQDFEALASLHTGSIKSCPFPPPDATSPPLVLALRTEPRLAQPAVHNPSVQEPRVATLTNQYKN